MRLWNATDQAVWFGRGRAVAVGSSAWFDEPLEHKVVKLLEDGTLTRGPPSRRVILPSASGIGSTTAVVGSPEEVTTTITEPPVPARKSSIVGTVAMRAGPMGPRPRARGRKRSS